MTQSGKTSSTNLCTYGAFNWLHFLSSSNPKFFLKMCLWGHHAGLRLHTQQFSPVLTRFLDPKGQILLYHYSLYALTGTQLCESWETKPAE